MGLASGCSPDISAQSQTRWEQFILGVHRRVEARTRRGPQMRGPAGQWISGPRNRPSPRTFEMDDHRKKIARGNDVPAPRPRLPCAAHCAKVNLDGTRWKTAGPPEKIPGNNAGPISSRKAGGPHDLRNRWTGPWVPCSRLCSILQSLTRRSSRARVLRSSGAPISRATAVQDSHTLGGIISMIFASVLRDAERGPPICAKSARGSRWRTARRRRQDSPCEGGPVSLPSMCQERRSSLSVRCRSFEPPPSSAYSFQSGGRYAWPPRDSARQFPSSPR